MTETELMHFCDGCAEYKHVECSECTRQAAAAEREKVRALVAAVEQAIQELQQDVDPDAVIVLLNDALAALEADE